jgi:hypothetical protein
MVFQIGPNQWLVSAPEKFASVLQFEKSHETIIVNMISPSQLTLDANCNSSCTSFNLTPINDHNSKSHLTQETRLPLCHVTELAKPKVF